MHFFNAKAQGDFEYLLIVGGAVLISAIIISVISIGSGQTTDYTQENVLESLCIRFLNTEECNEGDPDFSGECSKGDCVWANGKCEIAENRTAGCFGGTGQIALFCGDGSCLEGDNFCPEDLEDCAEQTCQLELCMDGCAYAFIGVGNTDPGNCDSGTGCGTKPCTCDGQGTCITSASTTCDNGACEEGDGYCPEDAAHCEPQLCKAADCTNGCQYTNITNGAIDLGMCDSTHSSGSCTGIPCVCTGTGDCRNSGGSGSWPSCGNGICEAGDGTCPSDIGSCGEAGLCQTVSCENGCQYTNNGSGTQTLGECDATTGCDTQPCVCSGLGSCVTADSATCGNGICEAGDGYCPNDSTGCTAQTCKTLECVDGCQYTNIEGGETDTGSCDLDTGCSNPPCVCNDTGNCVTSGEISACMEISEPGNYFLSGNIDSNLLEFNCLDITAVGEVIIDCRENYIKGIHAIAMNNATDLELQDCEIIGVYSLLGTGLEVNGNASASVSCTGNTVIYGDDQYTRGISLSAASNKTISNCTISGQGSGISIDSSSFNTVQNSIISGTRGINIQNSSENSITGNTINGEDTGIFISSGNTVNNLFSNNVICGAVKDIDIRNYQGQDPGSGNNTCGTCSDNSGTDYVCPCETACPGTTTALSECKTISEPGNYYLTGNLDSGGGFTQCIDITATGNVSIDCQGNQIQGGPSISMDSGTNLFLDDCIILSTGTAGIKLAGPDAASVACSEETIIGGAVWLNALVISGNNKTISDCKIINSGMGAYIESGSGNTIENCYIEAQFALGIDGSNNSILNSTINSNNSGIYVSSTGSNNLFSNNIVCGTAGKIWLDTINPQNPASANNTCIECIDDSGTAYVCPCTESCSGGTELDDCAVISEPGNYSIQDGIFSPGAGETCIDITANGNIVLDCQDNFVEGGPAIEISGAATVLLKDCLIWADGGPAILFTGNDRAIAKCTGDSGLITGDIAGGVSISNASNKTIADCSLNGTKGVVIQGSSNTVQGCSIDTSSEGIEILENSPNNKIIDNIVCDNISTNNILILDTTGQSPESGNNRCERCEDYSLNDYICNQAAEECFESCAP